MKKFIRATVLTIAVFIAATSGEKLSAQTVFTQTLGPLYYVLSATPFTYTNTPPTTDNAMVSFYWVACWESGFGGSQIWIDLQTTTGFQNVFYNGSNFQACITIPDTFYLSAAQINDAIIAGGGNITFQTYISDGCQAGFGCDNVDAPSVIQITLTYVAQSVNFSSDHSTTCPGNTVNFIDQSINTPTAWQWSFPNGTPSSSTDQNPQVVYDTPGSYDVTLIAFGTDTDTITYSNYITVRTPPMANAGADAAFCPGDNVQLNASGGVYYSWSPSTGLSDTATSNPFASPATTTTYALLVIDSFGCTGSDTLIVSVRQLPDIIASAGSGIICNGDSAYIVATGAQTYAWSPSSTLSSPSGQSVFAFPSGTTTYTVTGTDIYGCHHDTTVTIIVNPLPASPVITLVLGSLQSTPAIGYQWFLDGNPISGATGQSYIPLQTGNYTVQITDANGCHAMSLPFPVTDVSTAICPGGTVQFTDESTNSATAWLWTFNGGTPSGSTEQNPSSTYTSAGVYDVVEIAYGTDTQTITHTSYVIVRNPPTANAGADTTICEGDTTQLNGSGGAGFSWQPLTALSSGSISNPLAFPNNSITYILTVIDSNGCTANDSINITVMSAPTINASAGSGKLCLGDSIIIAATGGQTYAWTPSSSLNGSTGQSVFAFPTITTTYTVTGRDAFGCKNDTTVIITVYPPPMAPVISPQGGDLTSTAASAYQWYFNSGQLTGANNQTITPSQNGNYSVLITDSNGCQAMSLPYNVTNAGINDIVWNNLQIAPNPVDNTLTISFSNNAKPSGNLIIKMCDALGRIFINQIASTSKTELDMRNLPSGVYVLQMECGDKSTSTRIVVSH